MDLHKPDDRFSLDPNSGLYTPRTLGHRPEKKPKKKTLSKLRKVLTFGLATATLGYLISYTNAAWRTVAEMQRQTRLDERPWIRVITPLAPEPPGFLAGKVAKFHVIVRALGKTPAQDVHGEFAAEIVKEDEPVTLSYGPSLAMQSGIMFPTEEQVVDLPVYRAVADTNVVAEPRPITKAEADLLNSGKAEVAIYGNFKFADVFGVNHSYHFCVLQSLKQERTVSDWAAKQTCGKYNDTDNN